MEDITNTARAIKEQNTIPEETREQYLFEYNKFLNWKTEKKVNEITEDVLLAYFKMLSKMYKPSTLITICSKLKACLSLYDHLAIENFTDLHKFIKRTNRGYETKKAKVLNMEDIQSFVTSAPDEKYLVLKVILILGVVGVLRKTDLYNLEMSQITDKTTHILVELMESKTKKGKSFPRHWTIIHFFGG